MYDSHKIAEKIRIELKEQGITSKKMLDDLNFGKETILTMEKGSMIKCDRLGMIADYLKCSVDYLLGREKNINIIDNNKIITSELQPLEQELLNQFRKYSKIEQLEILKKLEENDANDNEQ